MKALLCLALLAPVVVFAAATPTSPDDPGTQPSAAEIPGTEPPLKTLAPVIVTATRTAETVDQSLASVTIITRDDIDRLEPHSVEDLLTGLPGVSIATTGDYGKSSSLFLRGTNANQVLVLIDGVKIGSATLGSAALEQLPVDQIERIELVRGPRSSLYGSDAIGGVIQIFTRQGKPGEALTPSFSIGGGSHDTYQGEAGVSGSLGKGWYNGSLAGFFTNGIPICSDASSPAAPCMTTDPRKGYWSDSGVVTGGYRWDNGTQLTLDYLRNYGDTKFDGSFTNQSKLVQQAVGGKLSFTPLQPWKVSLSAGQSLDQENDYYSGSYEGFVDTRRNTLSWQNDVRLAEGQQVSLGVDYQQDHVISDPNDDPYAVRSREDIGGFGLYQGTFGRNNVQLSLREDHNEQFGNHLTGSTAWGYTFIPALRVTASYGTAFNAPTFDDLYFLDYGVPTLRPENSRSAELGFGGGAGRWTWALNGYQTYIDNLIIDGPTAPEQIYRARIRGVEAQAGVHWNGWRIQGYLNYLDPRNRTSGDSDNLLPRRPQQTARLDIDRDFRRFYAGGTIYAAGRSFDTDALGNMDKLGGYGTVDLRAGYQLSDHWLFQAQIKNLLDKNYETVRYYNQLGRTFFLTLRYHPSAV